MFWISYFILLLLFYVFSSPFIENRELRNRFNRSLGYVYFSVILWLWLTIAACYHISDLYVMVPWTGHQLGPSVPLSLYFPVFGVTAAMLLGFEVVINSMRKFFVFEVSIYRDIVETLLTAAVISGTSILLYTECWDESLQTLSDQMSVYDMIFNALTEQSNVDDFVCSSLHDHTSARFRCSPWLAVWLSGMAISMVNFVLERLTPVRGIFTSTHLQHHIAPDASVLCFDSPCVTHPRSHSSLNLGKIVSNSDEYDSKVLAWRKRFMSLLKFDTPKQLGMVNWYSLAQTNLLWHIGLSLKIFMGRFDIRELQQSLKQTNYPDVRPKVGTRWHDVLFPLPKPVSLGLSKKNRALSSSPELYKVDAPKIPDFSLTGNSNNLNEINEPLRNGVHTQYSQDSELWFDFMADCGDGFNPSYTIARALAQPEITVKTESGNIELPRARLLLIGGDLAYPAPNEEEYESRLFSPFQDAMPPPPHYSKDAVSVWKPDWQILHDWFGSSSYMQNERGKSESDAVDMEDIAMKAMSDYEGPICYAIPGNHDWFDGLATFLRRIVHRDWLGGWLLPQTESYFSLKLPHGWYIFGVDKALNKDIDCHQLKYFARIAMGMNETDRVIIITHEPTWVLDPFEHTSTEENLSYLKKHYLHGKVALQLAGDLHHYTRHSPVVPTCDSIIPHYIVSGGGGAFCFPTHAPDPQVKYFDHVYNRVSAYPPPSLTKRLAWMNVFGFRRRNWRFDIAGAVAYFIIIASLLPVCSDYLSPVISAYNNNFPVFVDKPVFTPSLMPKIVTEWLSAIIGVLTMIFEFLVRFINFDPFNLWEKWGALIRSYSSEIILNLTQMLIEPVKDVLIRGFSFAWSFLSPSLEIYWPFFYWILMWCYFSLQVITAFGLSVLKLYIVIMSSTTWSCFILIVGWIALFQLVEGHLPLSKRLLIGTGHFFAHTFSALSLLLALELLVDGGVRHGYLSSTESVPLWTTFIGSFPKFSLFLVEIDKVTWGIASFVLRNSMGLFDVPEVYATRRSAICAAEELSRLDYLLFYLSFLLYMWILSTPIVSFVFGSYLTICLNVFDSHVSEAFSSLRIEDYKNFLRMHIKSNGDLEIYVVGIDIVPKTWVLDPAWSAVREESSSPSFRWHKPSRWKPMRKDAESWKLVDYVLLKKPKISFTPCSIPEDPLSRSHERNQLSAKSFSNLSVPSTLNAGSSEPDFDLLENRIAMEAEIKVLAKLDGFVTKFIGDQKSVFENEMNRILKSEDDIHRATLLLEENIKSIQAAKELLVAKMNSQSDLGLKDTSKVIHQDSPVISKIPKPSYSRGNSEKLLSSINKPRMSPSKS